MEKKPSKEIKIWAWIYIAFGLGTIILFPAKRTILGWDDIVLSIASIVLGIYLFRLMEWARIGAIIYEVLNSIRGVYKLWIFLNFHNMF